MDGETVKRITGKAILQYAQDLGYVREQSVDGQRKRTATEDGRRHGITMETGAAGTAYGELYYTADAQRMIVESFVAEDF